MCGYINSDIIQEDFTMGKTIYGENNGLWYALRDDYFIPCLTTVPTQEEKPIGIWGQRHLQYIKKARKPLYTELPASGRLDTCLADINEQATEQMFPPTKRMAGRDGVNEQLKAQDQMLRVQQMNNIRAGAMEIVNHDLIYA